MTVSLFMYEISAWHQHFKYKVLNLESSCCRWVVFVDGYDLIRDVIVDSSSSPHYTPMCLQQYDDGKILLLADTSTKTTSRDNVTHVTPV